MMRDVTHEAREQRCSGSQAKARRRRPLFASLSQACFLLSLTACAPYGACGIRECPNDAGISADVRARLAQNPEFGASEISVQTNHGVVYLRGLVSTPYQVSIAGSIAASARGVSSVQNLVVVDNSR